MDINNTEHVNIHLFVVLFNRIYFLEVFSCRSSTVPRLLFGGKKLTTEKNSRWWRINIIRSRALGRKSIQPVLDSDNLLNPNHTNFEYVQPDSFFMSGDYLLLECENISQTNCYFLLYYMFKSKPTADENFCQHNDYPNLFKYLFSWSIIDIIRLDVFF